MRCVYILFMTLIIVAGCERREAKDVPVSRKPRPRSAIKEKEKEAQGVPIPRSVSPKSAIKDRKTDVMEVDLNGDGKYDVVRFSCVEHSDTFSLFINEASIGRRGDNLDGHFRIVDIDSTDDIKEVAITESGPSDDNATYLFYYDGQNIILMGRIQGSYEVNIDGSGVLTTRTRGKILHTWWFADSYKLSKDHMLEHIDKDLYTMNESVTMKKNLYLQKSRTDSETIVILVPSEKVKILASDNKEWCLVENAKGIKGWFAVDRFRIIRGTGKRASEIFEGLCYAD